MKRKFYIVFFELVTKRAHYLGRDEELAGREVPAAWELDEAPEGRETPLFPLFDTLPVEADGRELLLLGREDVAFARLDEEGRDTDEEDDDTLDLDDLDSPFKVDVGRLLPEVVGLDDVAGLVVELLDDVEGLDVELDDVEGRVVVLLDGRVVPDTVEGRVLEAGRVELSLPVFTPDLGEGFADDDEEFGLCDDEAGRSNTPLELEPAAFVAEEDEDGRLLDGAGREEVADVATSVYCGRSLPGV